MGYSAQGFAIESRLSLDGRFGEEVQEELVRFVALAACGFKEAAQDAVVLQALIGASALDDFAHEDHRAQTALSLIVGGRDVGPAKASEEEFLFGAQQTFAEGFGLRVAERRAA